MKTTQLPSVRVSEQLRADAESVLAEGESLSALIEESLRRAVEHRRLQAAFHQAGDEAWAELQRTSRSVPAEQVLEQMGAATDRRRAALRGQ